MSEPTRVKVRGIYATALTELCRRHENLEVVQASPPIQRRFDADFDALPAETAIDTTDSRQGVSVVGRVDPLREPLRNLALDTLTWTDSAPRGAIFDGRVTTTKGSGAVVDLGETEGFLPFSNAEDHIETGDTVRVQVDSPRPPWANRESTLDTTLRVHGDLLTLVRGERTSGSRQPELADLLSADPPEGWRAKWERHADDASLDALGDALESAIEQAEAIDAALEAGGDAPADTPQKIHAPADTLWAWFGRESRFALDTLRADVTTTMAGHHRIKAGTNAASAAVDFVEAVCDGGEEFPFQAVTQQFGPQEGDRVAIDHGKPAGRCIRLGKGKVVEYDPEGTITVEREMSGRGTYDGLGVDQQAGDIAETKLTEGKWWYPTTYRGADGDLRGTYVNVCTPVEIFPKSVRYVDLHVDVLKHRDGTVERVDDDELDAAVEAGDVPEALAEKARKVASALENAL